MNIFFTADEHYGHDRIRGYTNRPFGSIYEMDETLIANHNKVVHRDDMTYHLGDFTLSRDAGQYQRRLNGHHIYLEGSHDYWITEAKQIIEIQVSDYYIVLCHYAMRTWPKSHYGSWQLHGHSHGQLKPQGKQWDVGVDNNNFFPRSFAEIVDIMRGLPENENLIRKE